MAFRFPVRSELKSEFEATATKAQFTSAESVVFVDVGARKVEPSITRDGIAVPALPIDVVEFEDFFAGRPRITQKVVSQSVAPGTSVPQGTAINLVMAEPGTIPTRVIEGVHLDLRERTFAQVYSDLIEPNPDVVRILARSPSAEALSATDEQVIRDTLQQADIAVGDEPGRDIEAGFQTLKAGLTFGR